MSDLFVQYLIIGLANGALIALIALGYTLVYGIVEIINFAHGEVFMMGAFFATSLVTWIGVTRDSAPAAIIGMAFLALIGAMLFSAVLNFWHRPNRVSRLRQCTAPGSTDRGDWIQLHLAESRHLLAWLELLLAARTSSRLNYVRYNILNEWFGLDTSIRIRPLDLAVLGTTIPLLHRAVLVRLSNPDREGDAGDGAGSGRGRVDGHRHQPDRSASRSCSAARLPARPA